MSNALQKIIHRQLSAVIQKDLDEKPVILFGPRQVGKTTLARHLFDRSEYLNYDYPDHRAAIDAQRWDRSLELVVLDEIHKKGKWKLWLKGIFDVEGVRPRILVTGSARLDLARKVGDSMSGRYYSYRLYPFDHLELRDQFLPHEVTERLMKYGGFPEPFLKNSDKAYGRWKDTHLDMILRQDMIDLCNVTDVLSLSTLTRLLAERVGSTVSYASLARDLDRDPKTVKAWVEILESLYVVFRIFPYARGHHRSIRKEPKIYFFDLARVQEPAARLENMVALSLLKRLHFLKDVEGKDGNLHFLKTKDQKEIDFCVLRPQKDPLLIEVKTSDAMRSPGFAQFSKGVFGRAGKLQLVMELPRETSYPDGLEIRGVANWLTHLDRWLN